MPPLHPPDPNGNFLQRSTTNPAWMALPNFTFNITPTDRNRFPTPHAYTNSGRLTNDDAGNTFGYGPDGELLALIRPGATVAYRYNGVGERVARSVTTGGGGGGMSTIEEFYFHDQAGDLLSIFDRTSPSNQAYSRLDFVRANGQLLYTAEHDPQPFPPPQPKYELAYLTDHLGSTRSVVQLNSSPPQQTYQEFEYFPYGYAKSEVTRLAFPPGTEPRVPVGFQGHLKEPETQLWYFKARYLHSGMGRFLTVDPIDDVDPASPFSWNKFAFVRANPLSYVDPDGRFRRDASCNTDEFAKPIDQAVQDVCSRTTTPGTDCFNTLAAVSQALGKGSISDCFAEGCEPDEGPILKCGHGGSCGKVEAGFPSRITINSTSNSGCPINCLGSYAETVLHERLHDCVFGSIEPDGKSRFNDVPPEPNQPNAIYFRLIEEKCYGWRDTNAPPVPGKKNPCDKPQDGSK